MPIIIVLHCAIVLALVTSILEIREVNGLPRVLFGFLGLIAVLEWRVALWILDRSYGGRVTADVSSFAYFAKGGYHNGDLTCQGVT
jgi:hypothetical protein